PPPPGIVVLPFSRLPSFGPGDRPFVELTSRSRQQSPDQTPCWRNTVGPSRSSASSAEPQRTQILQKTIARPEGLVTCQAFLKAVRTLTSAELDVDFLFPLLKHCFDNFDVQKIREAMRYTLAHVDVIWHSGV